MGKQQEALLAKKMSQKRKANPKLVLNHDNRTIIFEQPPVFSIDRQLMQNLLATGKFNNEVELVALEIVDGKANVIVRPVSK